MRFISIEKSKATELVVRNHYLHRSPPISWAWGIIVSDEIKGILTVGRPVTWSACSSVVGEKHSEYLNPCARSHDVYELNRLWVDDALPKNTESQFIAWCLRELKKVNSRIILISYADGSQGHVGYVYQATNWLYLGKSAEFDDICPVGFSDYRSVREEIRGGVVYRCEKHGFFEGNLPKKSKVGSKDRPVVPESIACPICHERIKKIKSRAWAFVRDKEGILKKRGDVRRWIHITKNGTAYTMELRKRPRRHLYTWFSNKEDQKLLPENLKPRAYPKQGAQ